MPKHMEESGLEDGQTGMGMTHEVQDQVVELHPPQINRLSAVLRAEAMMTESAAMGRNRIISLIPGVNSLSVILDSTAVVMTAEPVKITADSARDTPASHRIAKSARIKVPHSDSTTF